jgi:hypothetical protein
MYRYLVLLLTISAASAHEFTPTYPKLETSYVEGVLYTSMTLFNARKDVEYYEFGVFNAEWEKVPFAMQNKVMRFKHLEKKKVDIYIREKDKEEVVYICSKSKLIVTGSEKTSISSRICSKVK